MPLRIAYSADGVNFTGDQIFQDSSGVPSITIDTNGVLVCAFQWFPAPINSLHWDSVAVKFSYDSGFTWTLPVPCTFSGMPPNFKRPFDPAIVCTENGKFRLYFSCGPSGSMLLDSTVNTYSAISDDAINYVFEPNPRFDNLNDPVIDPCVVLYNGLWHYSAPIGAPQDGAYHATSANGLNFAQLSNITSDNQHVWGGNMLNNGTDIRFYGSTTISNIFYSSSVDVLSWSSYVNTNVTGGDPAVFKTSGNTYIIVYVGPPYVGTVEENNTGNSVIFPNPAGNFLTITSDETIRSVEIYDLQGNCIIYKQNIVSSKNLMIDVSSLRKGNYIAKINNSLNSEEKKVVIK